MSHLFLQNRDRRILVGEFGCESVPKNMESGKLRWCSKFLEHGFQTVLDDVVSTPRLRALQVRKEQPPRIILPSLLQIILERGSSSEDMGSEAVDVSVLVRPIFQQLEKESRAKEELICRSMIHRTRLRNLTSTFRASRPAEPSPQR